MRKIILYGTVGGRRKGRPHKSWKNSIKEWTGQSLSLLLRTRYGRSRRETITADASVRVSQRRQDITEIGLLVVSEYL